MRGDAAPFDFVGDDRGVLCVHGFTGTPFEMRFLGERLHRDGFTVRGIALPGHRGDPAELAATRFTDWAEAVAAAFADLQRRCRTVAVVGQSLGGLLALHLAATVGDQISAVAALATPLPLGPVAMTAIKLARSPLASRVPRLPKMGGSDVRASDARRANPAYDAIPTPALIALGDAIDTVAGELALVTAPLLIVHARNDHTAPVASADRIAGGTRSRQLRTRILERSFHLITIDVEREIVAAEVGTFFTRAARA